MTFCLTMKVKDGLVGLADTMITSGTSCSTATKVIIPATTGHHTFYIMSSGLRSLRDKALTYFQEVIDDETPKFNKLYKAVNAFAKQVRRVADEDKVYLKASNLSFNIHTLVAGQLEDDDEHKLYLLYPEGNWIEVGHSSPYAIIGNSGFGKPILNMALRYESSMEFALKVGFLAFSATKLCATDVDYPLDIVLYKKNSYKVVSRRYERDDLNKYAKLWTSRVSKTITDLPDEWMDSVFDKLR
jgi:putative proteasome-type protease